MSTPEEPQQDKQEVGDTSGVTALAFRFRSVLAVLLLIVTCVAIFSDQLDHQFTNWDDNWLITDNVHIRDVNADTISTILDFRTSTPELQRTREELGNEYLPIRDFSYMLDYQLARALPVADSGMAHGYRPVVYATTNLILHIFVVLLVFLLTMQVTRSRLAGLIAALIFAVMPIHVEVVSWMSSRKDLLASSFSLLAVIAYLKARTRSLGRTHPDSHDRTLGRNGPLLYGLSVACFLMAMLSKTPAIVVPGLILLVEVFFAHRLIGASYFKRAAYVAPFTLIALVIFFGISKPIASNGLLREPYGGDWTTSTWTVLDALVNYPISFILGTPVGAVVDAPIVESLSFAGVVTFTVLLVSSAFVGFGAIQALRLAPNSPTDDELEKIRASEKQEPPTTGITKRQAFRVAGFGIGWVLASFVPVCNLIERIGTVYADRYAYLPSVGFCIAVAAAIVCLAGCFSRRKKWAAYTIYGTCALWVTWQASVTVATIPHWKSSTQLWGWVLDRDPENHTALFNKGRTFLEKGMEARDVATTNALLERAKLSYETALEHRARSFRDDLARVHLALAQIALDLPIEDEAERDQRFNAVMEHATAAAHHIDQPWRDERDELTIRSSITNVEGRAYLLKGDESEARKKFEASAKSNATGAGAQNLFRLELREAEEAYEAAKNWTPDVAALFEKAEKTLNTIRSNSHLSAQTEADYARLKIKQADALYATGGRRADAEDAYRIASEAYGRATSLTKETVGAGTQALYALLLEYADSVNSLPGSEDEARSISQEAQRLYPKRSEAFVLEANILKSQRRFEEAAKVLKSTEGGDDHASVRHQRAMALLELGAQQEAIELLQENLEFEDSRREVIAIALQVGDALLKALRKKWTPEYIALKQSDDPDKEIDVSNIRDYELVAALQGNDQFAKELEAAAQRFSRAANLSKEDSEAAKTAAAFLTMLGHAWVLQEQPAQAEEILRRSHGLDQVNDETNRLLAAIYLNWMEEAARRMQGFLNADPPLVKDAEKELTSLWSLIGNMILLSDSARRLMAYKLTLFGNQLRAPIDLRYLKGLDSESIPKLKAGTKNDYVAEMKPVIQYYIWASEIDPEYVDALSNLQNYFRVTGDYVEATKRLEQLAESLEGDPVKFRQVLASKAQMLLLMARSHEARMHTALENKDSDAAKQARTEALSGFKDSAQAWEEAMKLAPTEHRQEYIRNLGQVYQKLSILELSEVRYWTRQALELYQQEPKLFIDVLVPMYRKLANLSPKRIEKIALYRDLLFYLDESPEIRADIEERIQELESSQSLSGISRMIDEGEATRALEILEERKLRGEEASELRGHAHLALNQRMKAAEWLERCTSRADPLVQAGKILVAADDDMLLGRAARAFDRALELLEQERLHLQLSELPTVDIESEISDVRELSEKITEHSSEIVREAMQISNPRQRAERLREAIVISPANFIAQTFLGDAHLADGENMVDLGVAKLAPTAYRNALAAYDVALALDPLNPEKMLAKSAEIHLSKLWPLLDTREQKEQSLIRADGYLLRLKTLITNGGLRTDKETQANSDLERLRVIYYQREGEVR